MPDGDIFHGLSGLYQKPYRILCEGKLERNECAWMTMQAFLKDIKKKGDGAILIAKGMGKLLAQEIKDCDDISSRSADLSKKLDRLAQQANIPNRTKSLVLEAGKTVLNRLRNGDEFDTSAIPELLIEGYMQKVYVSEFEARIPPISNDHAQVDNFTFTERMEALRKDIFDQINKWAKKANVDEGVANLRRNRRSQVKEIDMEEDLVI